MLHIVLKPQKNNIFVPLLEKFVNNMPGHVKLGKKGEADPDPMPYLVISIEQKRDDMMMEYDSKKTYYKRLKDAIRLSTVWMGTSFNA